MASERQWAAVSQAFTADGTADGTVKVQSVKGFKVKATVLLTSTALPTPLSLEIKSIPDETTIQVGPAGPEMTTRQDLSAYLVSDGAAIAQPKQKRPGISLADFARAIYEEEPTVALRTILVDDEGDAFDENNPIPIIFDGTIQIGNVRVTEYDNDPKPGDIHSSIRVGDGLHDLKINPDGSINVVTDAAPPNPLYAQSATTISSSAMTTIFSYASSSDTTEVTSLEVTVSESSLVQVLINGTLVRQLRTSPLERNAKFLFQNRQIPNGQQLVVQAQVDRFILASYDAFTSLEGHT